MFKIPRKPWLVSKDWEVGVLMFSYPGFVLAAAITVLVTVLSPDSDPSWWPWVLRIGGSATGLVALYYYALLIAWWKRDGYIDAILIHSQRLKAQQEAEKEGRADA